MGKVFTEQISTGIGPIESRVEGLEGDQRSPRSVFDGNITQLSYVIAWV